jgi:PQQ-dependent dehydrogenase (methanol/ethanol family)
MKHTWWMAGLLSLIGAAWITGIAIAQQLHRVDDAALRNSGKTGEEWLTNGLNYGETRYSPLKQIDPSNVSRLGLAWSYEIGPGGGTQESTPLVSNGVMYSVTNWSIVFALDARTGKEKWRWDPEVNHAGVAPKICCGVVNRGLGLYEGKVFVPVVDGRLVALDIDTGKPVWEARVAYPQDSYTLTMAPRVVHGRVLIGVSGAEYPVRGFLAAYDANTGRQAWRFYTVPGEFSKPPEDQTMRRAMATWDTKATKAGGGGTVWDSISYDPESDLIYFGTGNAGPWPADLRKAENKDNLFACSIVALKADTGEYKWHFQVVPSDSWDYDAVQQLILADLTIKGQSRKVIMQASKNGFFYVLDRLTGKFISGQPFVKVSWAKGLNEATGKPIVNDDARYNTESGAVVQPGPNGAHNWSPMSFNPTTGLVYIPSASGITFSYATDPNFQLKPGQLNLGIVFGPPPGAAGGRGGRGGASNAAGQPGGEVATAAAQAAAAPAPIAPPKPATRKPEPPVSGPDLTGNLLIAWDPVTQSIRWSKQGGGSTGGGTMTTAGNLVFQVIPTGMFRAYSADKGDLLLEIQTNLRSAMGPPMTYMLDGKQYVTIAGGQGAAGTGFGGGAASPITPKLLTFVLDGKAPLPEPPPAK